MKILIVGGGIAGLTLAGFLRDSNIDYEIVEKSAENKPGYLLIAWDNMRDILKKLGLADEFDAQGWRIDEYTIHDNAGNTLRTYRPGEFKARYGTGVTVLKRAHVCEWLTQKVDENRVRRGLSVSSITQNPDSVSAKFSDGSKGTYDAIIGADGVRSTVRAQCFPNHAEVYDDWRCWWAWIDNSYAGGRTIKEYIGAGEFVMVFDAGDKTLIVLHAKADHAVWDTEEGRVARLQKLFGTTASPIPDIVRGLKDNEILPSDIVEVPLGVSAIERVALIGDAAHSFGPFAGLGGSMAMEDAYVLAAKLQQVSATYSVQQALADYVQRRMSRLRVARRLSWRMKRWMIIESPLLRRLINIFVPYVPESLLMSDYRRLLGDEL